MPPEVLPREVLPREVLPREVLPRDVGLILVAAGQGTRFGGAVPKQYRMVAGVPMVLRALAPFLVHPKMARIALVVPSDDALAPPEFLTRLTATDPGGVPVVLVAGGPSRADSVAAGLAALPAECAVVLVHDGARPFVERRVVDEVIQLTRRGEGAVAALPVSDTLKEVVPGPWPLVERTVPRERLWRAQTPQGFPRALLERAYAEGRRAAPGATDDAELVEVVGGVVRLIHDSAFNMKVTSPEDLILAELIAGR